jgi:hypothetical protein
VRDGDGTCVGVVVTEEDRTCVDVDVADGDAELVWEALGVALTDGLFVIVVSTRYRGITSITVSFSTTCPRIFAAIAELRNIRTVENFIYLIVAKS